MVKPPVSVIIPTKNSEKTLPICLMSIMHQTYRNVEVIIVDNYSNDRTVNIAREFNANIIRCKCERAKAKNLGLNNSTGKYVIFIDSDMELTPRVVEECVNLAESSSKIAGIIIPEKSAGNSYFARVRDFERSFYADTSIESPRFFRRDLALLAGGFDEDLVFYEEATLPLKLELMGYHVRARIRSYIIHHEEEISFSTLIKKKYNYAKTARTYLAKYKHLETTRNQVDPIYRFMIFLKNPRFWRNPHLAVGVIFLKTLELFAYSLGYLSSLKSAFQTFTVRENE